MDVSAHQTPGGLGDNGDDSEIRALPRECPPIATSDRFPPSGISVDITHITQDSLESVAPGVSCYIDFCDWVKIDYFPTRTHRVKQWVSLFNPVETFGLYLSHRRKECLISGAPTDWVDESTRSAANG